jgi:hypothetical protein
MHDSTVAQNLGSGLSEAEKNMFAFVKTLTGKANAECSFRTFDDSAERNNKLFVRKFSSSLKPIASQLHALNEQGAGVFMVINEGGQTGAEITRIRAVFADTDGAELEPLLQLKPHMVVESSPGKWHVYWLVESDFPMGQFKPVQLAIAKKYGTDPAVHDLPRVMRVPGFYHCKGKPFLVRIIKRTKDLPPYSLQQIVDGLGLDLAPSAIPKTGIPLDNSLITASDYPPSDANRIADNCKQVALFRETGGTSEPVWHACLGLLKHCIDGERIAHEWSSQHNEYDEAETSAKMDRWPSGPTTCERFRDINAAGCEGCTHTCKSPIQLGVAEADQALPVWLRSMNERYAWIEQVAAIYRLRFRDFITMEKFHAAHANDIEEITAGLKTAQVTRSRLWLANKGRAQFLALVTRPGEPLVTSDNCLNEWAGFTVEPVAGDVSPFNKLYAYLFGSEQFPLMWLAHLIQQPGIKMFVSLVVWSKQEGVGKNLFFESIGNLFDPRHFALVGQSEIDDDFSGWIPGTVFMLGDEIRASKSEKARDRLKLWGTATTLRTHDKGQPKRVIENLMNQVYLSNHADGMFLSDYDRRFWVHEIKAGPLPESLKNDFLRWCDNGGSAHLLHHLMNVDLDGFDPKGRAPVTDSKKDMIEAGRSDLDRWAMDVVNGALPVGQEVATAERLIACFMSDYPHVRNPPSVSTVAKVLVRAGALRRENQIRLKDGRKVRALALVRTEHWKDQPESAWRIELEKYR